MRSEEGRRDLRRRRNEVPSGTSEDTVWKWLTSGPIAAILIGRKPKEPEIAKTVFPGKRVHPWMSAGFLVDPNWLEDARRAYEEGVMTDEEWQHTLRIAESMKGRKAAENLAGNS